MDSIHINPENYQVEYIRYLNQCFNNWGNEKEYDWAFNRTVGGITSDIVIIKDENNEVIAGSGITYRKLKNQDDSIIDIAIMTGSWTTPKARGRGCFTKIIDVSKEISRKKNVPYLTAFVMETNSSFRRLKNAGSLLYPSYNLYSPNVLYQNANESSISLISNKEQMISDVYNRYLKTQNKFTSFSYTTDEFFHQYLYRIKNTKIVKISNDYAIIEETENLNKVLLITYDNLSDFKNNIISLSNWGLQNNSKKLFLFSTNKEVAEICNILDFENLQGYFTVLSTSKNSVHNKDIFTQISINMGDKM